MRDNGLYTVIENYSSEWSASSTALLLRVLVSKPQARGVHLLGVLRVGGEVADALVEKPAEILSGSGGAGGGGGRHELRVRAPHDLLISAQVVFMQSHAQ